MRHEVSKELFRYWTRLRKERATPDRADLNPADIRHVLADTFLVAADSTGQFPIRLSGTRLDALWMSDCKGRSFLDLWGDDRHSLAAALWSVMDGAAPVLVGAVGAPTGRESADIEVLLLPLRHRGKTHRRILGSMSVAKPPAWIGLLPINGLRLVSLRVIDTDERELDLPILRKGPALPDAVLQRGHLTLYAGGR